jgi:hypothetical protein
MHRESSHVVSASGSASPLHLEAQSPRVSDTHADTPAQARPPKFTKCLAQLGAARPSNQGALGVCHSRAGKPRYGYLLLLRRCAAFAWAG